MKRKVLAILLALGSCLAFPACKPEDEGEPVVIVQLGIEVKDALEVYDVPRSQVVDVEFAITSDQISEEDYSVTVAVDSSLVLPYSFRNRVLYDILPADAYEFISTEVTLSAGSTRSATLGLRLKGAGCVMGKVYLLPISIANVQGGTNFSATEEGAAFILYRMGPPAAYGKGTQESPYLINTLDTFFLIDGYLRDDDTVYFNQTEDMDFTEIVFDQENPWIPITCAPNKKIFYDACDHMVSNFSAGAALFSNLVGTVQNLTIENATGIVAGGILADTAGSPDSPEETIVKNIIVRDSDLTSEGEYAGGLIGWLKGGTVENVEVACPVSGDQQVGGLIGRMDAGSIIGCSASGGVSATGSFVGGLIGQIAGDATIEKCHASGNVTGAGYYAGGLIGAITPDGITVSISRSYATGNVTIPTTGNFAHAGGLLGSLAGASTANISNCYATGAVTARRYSSGFVGTTWSSGSRLSISNSYTISDISGIVVQNYSGLVLGANTGTVTSCTGFIAWNKSGGKYCYPDDAVPSDGNYYGSEGTVSSHASALGWSTDIWDLGASEPVLK